MNRLPINFRAFIVIALFVIAAVFCAYLYALQTVVGIVLGCIVIIFAIALCAFYAVRFKTGKSALRYAIAFGLAAALCSSAFITGVTFNNGWKNSEYDGYFSVSGRVCAVDIRSGKYRFDLEEVEIDGISVDGLLRLTISPSDKNIGEFIGCGDKLKFSAELTTSKLVDDNFVDGTAYRTDIRYRATVFSDKITVEFGEPSAMENFLSSLRELYVNNMGEKYGNIAFSMLTGDKHALDTDITDYYSAAGLGHIMAVSGLHIGFLILLLNALLFAVKKKIRFPIILAFVLAYAVIADFSPSVVRAAIMATVSGAAVYVGGRRDILSSLLCAFSLILAVKPFYMFEVGFLLSFGAIFGIAMFADSIKRAIVCRGGHNKIGNAVGASVSVAAGIAPPQACFFGNVQILSVIVNIVLIPYVSAVFIAIVCLTPIAAIPHCGVVLRVCEYLMMPLDYIAYGISAIPYATVAVKSSAAVFLCYPIMFCASNFFMLKKGKTSVVIYSIIVCASIFAVCAL